MRDRSNTKAPFDKTNESADFGVESLRIVDGSIMPRVTTVKTMALYVVIGERDADILRTEHRSSGDGEVNK
jgi:choline dehydrogenase-like flavoprotein